MTITGLRQRLQSLDIEKVASNSLDETKDAFVELNKEQMFEGKNKQGDPIGMYQSKQYSAYKNALNPKPGYGVPDLKLTGAFYRGIKMDVSGVRFTVVSTDSKSSALENKYGDIFGLSTPFKSEFIDRSLQPEFIKEVKQSLGL